VAGELIKHKCESSRDVRYVKKERSDKFEYDVSDTSCIRSEEVGYIYIF
jgi:hypothetical protein